MSAVREYALRAGSVASLVVAHLQASEPGTRLTRDEIATLFQATSGNVPTLLAKPVREGLLAFTSEGTTRYYHLPIEESEETEPTAGPLSIAMDSTGDLWFSGARETTTGEVILSAGQLQQLVEFATTPPVLRPRGNPEQQS